MSEIELTGFDLTPEALAGIAAGGAARVAPAGLARMAASRAVIDQAVEERRPVYGVTTGLGPRVVEALPAEELERFALTTVRGRAHSVGADLSRRVCRGALAVRLNTLLIGGAGARPALAECLAAWLAAPLAPAIRETGSVGAADLMWGGDFGLAIVGEGRAYRLEGRPQAAARALKEAGIAPYAPGPREGLALVSHSSISAALAALLAADGAAAFAQLQTAAALSIEGFRANLTALDPDLLALRPQAGQLAAAEDLRARLDGSALWTPGAARRLQDPLSIRNIPQVHGAALAGVEMLRAAAADEINGASDNPGVLVDRGEVLSHGGYLTSHLFTALTAFGQAWAHAASAQTARIARLLSARFTDLPNGLTAAGAAGAGIGPLLKTAEALWDEIARLAAPPALYPSFSADGLEDVAVPTGLAARNLHDMMDRQRRLTAIELIVAAQAVEHRELPEGPAPKLRPVMGRVRALCPTVAADRPLGGEIEAIAAALAGGWLTA